MNKHQKKNKQKKNNEKEQKTSNWNEDSAVQLFRGRRTRTDLSPAKRRAVDCITEFYWVSPPFRGLCRVLMG